MGAEKALKKNALDIRIDLMQPVPPLRDDVFSLER